MKGTVFKSTGSWYTVRDNEGRLIPSRIKGVMRLKNSKLTNPVAVGDYVEYEFEQGRDEAVISDVHDRKNYIIRKSNKLSKQYQVIAANLDQAMLVVTLKQPFTSTGFIDRFVVTAEAYDIPVVILFNKTDLYAPEEMEIVQELMDLYQSLGYECIAVSAKDQKGLDTVKNILHSKTTLISGHSGVGKSTLLNLIAPGIEQKTGDISSYSNKGKHTTTFAEMFETGRDTFIIDTPGIKDFGVIDISEQELSHYFPEMRKYSPDCRFHNCRHTNEPGCAVLQALEEGNIAASRYHSYLSIMAGEDMHH